jgi:hypothetical protein
MKNLQGLKEHDPRWIKEIAEGLLDVNIDNFSASQKKMLCSHYLEYLNDGLKPKEAMEKALQIVLCFKL